MQDGTPPAPRILVVGPVAWNHLITLPCLPAPTPHMAMASHARWTLGGTSAGKALNLADLGADVHLITMRGDDEAGRQVSHSLHHPRLTVTWLDSPTTESHTNLMTPRGERLSIYTATPGEPSPTQVARVVDSLQGADAVVADLSPVTLAALPEIIASGLPVLVDLHDYDGDNSFHRPFRDAATVLTMSNEKLPHPEPFLTDVVEHGAALAVCTRGASGAVGVSNDGIHETPAAGAVVVDTNGAGDAFASALFLAWLDGATPGTAMEAGAAQAGRVVASATLLPS